MRRTAAIENTLRLEETYRRYGASLRAAALRVLREESDAADCVHDVLLRVLQRAPSYRPERGSFRTYLLVAVRNEAVSRVRRSRRHEDLERFAAAGRPDTYDLRDADVVDVERLRAAVATLPSEQKTALELAYDGGLSHVEIAERLGVPLGTIKSRLVLAMRKLRTAVR